MESREKLENPIIEFTKVTFMGSGPKTSCECVDVPGHDPWTNVALNENCPPVTGVEGE